MLVAGREASGMMAVLETRLGSTSGTETREPMNILGLGFSRLARHWEETPTGAASTRSCRVKLSRFWCTRLKAAVPTSQGR